jgi:hypothetical protein
MKSFLSWRTESEIPKTEKNETREVEESNSIPNQMKPLNESIFSNYQQDFRDALRNMLNPGQQWTPPQPPPDFREPLTQQKETREEFSFPSAEQTGKKKKIRERIHREDPPTPQEEFFSEEEEMDLDFYKLYRDKEETFECNVTVEGASLASSQARIIIDTADINLVFYGKIYKDGRCLVPLKKMKHLPEGARGRIRLEVIVDDTLFVPWESHCKVEGAKKVKVQVKSKKSVRAQF